MRPTARPLSVFVYDDEGVSQISLLSLLSLFQKKILRAGVKITAINPISSDEIINGQLRGADGLIVPGGADLPYCKKLNGRGNRQILAFIASGGIYIGICAGGYYGARQVVFDGNGYSIRGNRELSLFKGKAIGSIARYDTDKAAAITGTLGLGQYLLTGVHFELCSDVYEKQVFTDDNLQQLTPQALRKEKQLLEQLKDDQYGQPFYRKMAQLLEKSEKQYAKRSETRCG